MDTRTGEIVRMDLVEALKEKRDPTANFYKEIPDRLLPMLKAMNRKERRKWYKKNKKQFR